MKNKPTNRLLLTALTAGVGIFQASCSTSTSEAWNKIQTEGLIPYMAEHQSARAERGALAAQRRELPAAKIRQAPQHAETPIFFTSGVVTAKAVDGRPGFVYSPHTDKALMVDVTEYEAGTRVRCPYTKKSFIVPGMPVLAPRGRSSQPSMVASNPPARRSQLSSVSKPPTQVASTQQPRSEAPAARQTSAVTPKHEKFEKMPGVEDLLVDEPIISEFPSDKTPARTESLALPKRELEEVPVGKPVPGKPNYVYSPFASSNQVVDVEGYAAGTKVKCPYTGKVFAVPAAD